MDSQNKSPHIEGLEPTKLAGGVGKNRTAKLCNARHLNKLARELQAAGLALSSTCTDTQLTTLLRLLQYLGPRGLSTYEAVAAGYARVATRVFELDEAGWLIHSQRENIIAPDGLFHPSIARYVLIGKKADLQNPQLDLGLVAA